MLLPTSNHLFALTSALLFSSSASANSLTLERRLNNNNNNINAAFTFQIYSLDNYWVPSGNIQTSNVLKLTRKTGGQPVALRYLEYLRNGKQSNGVFGQEDIDVTDTGLIFATEIDVGGKKYEVVIDTGSADTWLPKSNFTCVALGTGDKRPQSTCGLASTYTQTPTFKSIPNQNFYVQYTDGESLRGTFGYEDITVANLKVKRQQFALVDVAAWIGDTATSGLLGLAFPAATKAFKGNNYRDNTPASQIPYDPVFTSLYKRGGAAPLFSIALDRNQGGQLAIGGLPKGVDYFPVFASSPFQLLTTSGSGTVGTSSNRAYTLYTITTNGFQYGNASSTSWSYNNAPNPFGPPSDKTQVQVIIDTATVNIFLPPTTADAINAGFNPKPLYKTATGLYVVPCTAKAPRFGVKIGFETFFVNEKDMVINLGERCVSAVAATGVGGTSILGEAFLKNVLAVFDVGAQMMRFAARENY